MTCDEFASSLEVIGSLQRQGFDIGQCPLDQAGQGACWWQLDDGCDAEFGHGLHAQVPAHGVVDLGDQAGQELDTAVNH